MKKTSRIFLLSLAFLACCDLAKFSGASAHRIANCDINRSDFLHPAVSSIIPGRTEPDLPSRTERDLDLAVSRILARHFRENGPGVALLVARRGKVQFERSYGLADIRTKRPITTNSLFDLASLSKQFTAMAVLLLIQDGKLVLSDPVQKLVPDFRVAKVGRSITVGDLIHHVSGLGDYTGDEWEGDDQEFAALTPETHLKWINRIRPRRAPGKNFEYNNSGYALLALIVERISQVPFSEFLRRRVFNPAGMTSTRVYDKLGLKFPNMVTGYKTARGRVQRSSLPSAITGDGNIFTSIDDMARWDAALYQERLARNLRALAWTTGKLDNGKTIVDEEGYGYGFGWKTDTRSSSIFHTGSWYGTSTYIVRYLDTGITIIVLSNDENADAAAVADEIEGAIEE